MTTTTKELLKIARIIKSHGTDGDLLADLSIPSEDIDKSEPVYIIFDGLPVPFFIESIAAKGNRRAIIRLTDIENLEDADEIAGKDIYLPDDGQYGHEDSPGNLEGWIVCDNDGNEIGEVTGFLDIPSNPCLTVLHEGKEAYIPFHEDLITGYDEASGKIRMTIPDGLLS